MYSSKTTHLMAYVQRALYSKQAVLVVKHVADNRYAQDASEPVLRPRDGPSLTTSSGIEIVEVRRLADASPDGDVRVVIVDEGHFFPDLAETTCAWADAGLVVYVAALSGTYTREPFTNVAALSANCDTLTMLRAVCVRCAGDAAFTCRIAPPPLDSRIESLVGGEEAYEARCRLCWQPPIAIKLSE